MEEFKPIVFQVGEGKYGVDISLVRGIEKLQPIAPIPNAGKHVKGIINLRGDVIPVFSLRSKFSLPEQAPTEETKLIVVQTAEFLLALEVDKVEEIQTVDEAMIYPVPMIIRGKETNYIKEIIGASGNLIVVIDVENVLTEDEKAEITEALNN